VIVIRFDVLEHAQPCGVQVGEPFVFGPLMFERPEEALHHGVVVAAAGAAHRALDSERREGPLVGVAGVLASSVAVMQLRQQREPTAQDRRWRVLAG